MQNICRVCVPIALLALVLASCGLGDTGASMPSGTDIDATVAARVQQTVAAQQASPLPATARAEPQTPEIAPTPCPVPGEGQAADCEATYQALLARIGQDYSSCGAATNTAGSCPKPASLTGDLKEHINIQLILDSSGSMAADAAGRPKIEVAKEVMTGFVDTLPKEANVALRVYGHVGSNSEEDKPRSCEASELLYPFQALDAGTFKSAIASFGPAGWTPIARSLQQAQADFASYDAATNSNLIYLVSDGIETCDGDPVAAAQALHESNIQAVVNIVGFDVDAEAAAQLRAAAQAGGGKYYEARNAAEMQHIFQDTFNWHEWNKYYACKLLAANRQLGSQLNEQNTAYSCVLAKANQEYGTFLAELNADYKKYAKCYTALADNMGKRYQSIANASASSYKSAVDAADQEYRQAVQEAKQQPTPAPSK